MNAVPGLGARLRQARDLAGYNQQDAADAVGTAREAVSYRENDRRVPGYVQLAALVIWPGYNPPVDKMHFDVYRGNAQPT